jgi:hypothetical protein
MEKPSNDRHEEDRAGFTVGLFFIAVLAALFVIGLLR